MSSNPDPGQTSVATVLAVRELLDRWRVPVAIDGRPATVLDRVQWVLEAFEGAQQDAALERMALHAALGG